jgi:cysteine sulfinate desulfinase/cysteine desulfurase-like protein
MGLSMEEALGSLRLTVGYETTEPDVERVVQVLWSVLAAPGVPSPR